MASFKAHLLMYGRPDEVRIVEVPDDLVADNPVDKILDHVWYFGQNDFQPQQHPSLSTGDVIEVPSVDGGVVYYLVVMLGFRLLSQDEFDEYVKVPQAERYKEAFRLGE